MVVNVDASGSNVRKMSPNAKALGQAIGAAVQAELIKQQNAWRTSELMAATTFPTGIDADLRRKQESAAKCRVAQFGSGYSQRSTFGINQDPKVWDLTWENRTATDATTLKIF